MSNYSGMKGCVNDLEQRTPELLATEAAGGQQLRQSTPVDPAAQVLTAV
jgi:hypothetical protein